MLRKRRYICTGSIDEEGYLLCKFCNSYVQEGDVEIYPYNCITCHSYNHRRRYGEDRHGPDAAYCIASDLKTCFTYAKKHGLRILRVTTLDYRHVWKGSMEDVELELFGGPCPYDESDLVEELDE